MDSRGRLTRIVRGLCVCFGLFVLYCGLVDILSAAYVPPATVPWLDRALARVGRFVWLPAVGVLSIAVGVLPTVAARARTGRTGRALVGGFGFGLLCLAGFVAFVSLDRIGGFVYVSPLPVTGLLLLAVGLDDRRPRPPARFSS